MGVVLFVVAFILTLIVSIISIVVTPIYYLFTLRFRSGLKQLNKWFYKMALSIDQFGNVSCGSTLKLCLTKGRNYPFGGEDDTVSYVLGRNSRRGNLTMLGRCVRNVLNFIEKDHVDIAIERKIKSDKIASWRMKNENYWESCGI